jgi:hypothetical protein
MAELAEELKQFEKDNKAAVDRVTAGLAAFDEKHKQALQRLDAIEEKQRQKPARYEPGGPLSQRLTEALARSSRVLEPGKTVCEISTKDITGVSQSWPALYPQVVPLTQPQIGGVQSLIPSTPTTAGSIEYMEETTFTNLAAPVAEGAVKPKSEKTFTPRTSVVRTIAHYFKISKQTWDDLAMVAAVVERNGIYGVESKIEQQLLKGTGIAPELQGIYPLATATATPPAGDTMIDSWLKAVGQLGALGYKANGIVCSWADWTAVALLKDTQERYIASTAPPLPRVVQSPFLAAGEWIVGDFSQGSHIFERETVHVQVATQNEDDFIRNLITLLVEARLAHVVWRPAAFLKNAA